MRRIFIFGDGQRKVFPGKQVLLTAWPQAHVSPLIPERIVLIEEVILTFVIHQTIGIIGPVFGTEVELGPVGSAYPGAVVGRRAWRGPNTGSQKSTGIRSKTIFVLRDA